MFEKIIGVIIINVALPEDREWPLPLSEYDLEAWVGMLLS